MVSPIRARQLWDQRLPLENEDDSMQKSHPIFGNSDQEESAPLVVAIDHEHQPSSNSTHLGRQHHQQPSETIPWFLQVQIWHLAVAMIAVFLSSSIVFARSSSSSAWWDESTISKQQNNNVSSGPLYVCPTLLTIKATVVPSMESIIIQNATSNQEKSTQPASLDQVSWRIPGETYKQRKKYRSTWLTKRFSSLQSGNVIFEASCGTLGLDLIMTQKVLSRTLGIQSLGLYGANTMMEWPTSSSSQLPLTKEGLQTLVPFDSVSICDVDIGMSPSTFIPPQSFDAVFVSASNVDNVLTDLLSHPSSVLPTICQSTSKEGKATARLARHIQEVWYARQVSQALYMVKAGKMVAIEDIPLPLSPCNNSFRVDSQWWSTAVQEFGWPVDEDSIVVDEQEGSQDRYRVILQRLEIDKLDGN